MRLLIQGGLAHLGNHLTRHSDNSWWFAWRLKYGELNDLLERNARRKPSFGVKSTERRQLNVLISTMLNQEEEETGRTR
jgi:hypothetical protein